MENPIIEEDLRQIREVIGRCHQFDGSTIVITGCAGFLGFYFLNFFARYAEELGVHRIIGLDTFLLGAPDWLFRLAKVSGTALDLRCFDIAKDDLSSIRGADDARFVIHGASVASPTFYRQYPVETIDANVWGLRRLLDTYRGRETLQGLLFFSSSEIYGDPPPDAIPTSEDYRGSVSCHGPRACYDESKRFGETLCWVYANQYGMPVTVARPFNNYGPGMRLDDKRLPADFATAIVENRDIVILSDGTPTRTFCYIADAIAGYLRCLLHGKYDFFNIGADKPEIMVRELAQIYRLAGQEIFGYDGKVHYRVSDDPDYMTDNPNRRCAVIEKARKSLGYNPVVPVEDGVRRYLRFLKHEVQG